MFDILLNFCKWLQNTSLGLAVSGTLWGYPWVQLIHFFGLSIWIGTIVILDLRLLGVAARNQGVAELSDQLFPWTWTGFVIVITGGLMLFSASAATYVQNYAFDTKIPLVLIGIALHIYITTKVRKWDQPLGTPGVAKLAGLVELLIWVGVVTAAVNIPNY